MHIIDNKVIQAQYVGTTVSQAAIIYEWGAGGIPKITGIQRLTQVCDIF